MQRLAKTVRRRRVRRAKLRARLAGRLDLHAFCTHLFHGRCFRRARLSGFRVQERDAAAHCGDPQDGRSAAADRGARRAAGRFARLLRAGAGGDRPVAAAVAGARGADRFRAAAGAAGAPPDAADRGARRQRCAERGGARSRPVAGRDAGDAGAALACAAQQRAGAGGARGAGARQRHAGDRPAAAFRPAGLRARRRRGGAGRGQFRCRSDRRRARPRLCAAARQGDRRRARQHRGAHLHHLHGGPAGRHRRHLPHVRSGAAAGIAGKAVQISLRDKSW